MCLVIGFCYLWVTACAQDPLTSPTCSGGRLPASDPGCSTVEAGDCTLLRREGGESEAIEFRVPANKYVNQCTIIYYRKLSEAKKEMLHIPFAIQIDTLLFLIHHSLVPDLGIEHVSMMCRSLGKYVKLIESDLKTDNWLLCVGQEEDKLRHITTIGSFLETS